MFENEIGRLIRTTSEKCPICKRPLQVRARKLTSMFKDEILTKEHQYLACSNPSCEYERDLEQKIREKHPDKYSEPIKAIEQRGGGNGYSKPSRFEQRDRRPSAKSNRRGDRRNS